MKHFLYVIGEPGSGKSALVEAMVGDAEATHADVGFAVTVYAARSGIFVTEIGARREKFPGTDALAMNVQPKVQRWTQRASGLVFAEGDRLANAKFFDWLLATGWDLVIARIRVKPETAAARRDQRDARQDESWVESRRTKVDRLGATFPERTLNLWHEDGGTEEALAVLRERSPVAAAFA